MEIFLLESRMFYRNNETHAPWCVESFFRFAKYYLTPVLVVLGIITNILIIIAFNNHKRSHKSKPGEICLTAMTVSDIAFLATLLAVWLSIFCEALSSSNHWCLMTAYIFDITVFSSLWTVVILSMTSILLVCKPQWYTSLLTTRMTALIMVGIFIIAIIVYLNISLLKGIVWTTHGPACLTLELFTETREVLGNIDIVINFVIPYSLILLMIILTSWRYNVTVCDDRRSHQRESVRDPIMPNGVTGDNVDLHEGLWCQGSQQMLSQQSAIIKLSLITSSLYLACSTPCHVLQVYVRLAPESEDPVTFWHILHWQQLLLFIFFMRPSLTFWCIFTTNQYFRRMLALGFQRRRMQEQSEIAAPVTVTEPTGTSEQCSCQM